MQLEAGSGGGYGCHGSGLFLRAGAGAAREKSIGPLAPRQ
ncbi:hypothetical protein L541_1993 [Bordetella hinzii CA90 BAL1384]|uniref:Uncharacterized protein n=1 Tax=Bordetella hinzii OH87 BAL007II TaxID=1331262 RepID=A0ABR4R141_9BORD|nr:hypothetical protein L544_2219 [Bordetella hinzii OH87 BAL007II]KCB31549.1 hypothetical protein L543_1607 [Bordetella hinzii L60]KCB32697.1 hypothetical protein L541_1993 [Bordetella hinzii CA90 BAL1384]KCB40632.1 hypothetical protein L539_2529 [Bordetella hinzii 5132]